MSDTARPEPRPGEPALFASVRRLAHAIAIDGNRCGKALDLDAFEDVVDHTLIVRPEPKAANFRFDFFGAEVADSGPFGDMKDACFGDVIGRDLYLRKALSSYPHVALTRSAYVSLNWRMPNGQLISRLIVPLFAGGRVGLIVAAIVFHDEPIHDELAAYSPRLRDLPKPTHAGRPHPRPVAVTLPFRHA